MTTPYRDDVGALRERISDLGRKLEELRAKTRGLADLQRAEKEIESEIRELRERLDGASARRSLPLLESIRIAKPCQANWDEMVGDARVRFCGHCQQDVYNLSEMARQEAEQFMRERGGDACVRLYQRTDGTVMTSDCPVGVRRSRRRKMVAAAVGGGLLAAGALLHRSPAERQVLMGAMEAMPSAAPTVTEGQVVAPEAPTQTPAPSAAPSPRPMMGKMSVPRRPIR